MTISMLLGPISDIKKYVSEFFSALFDIIPKIMYLLYSSLACVLDLLQLFFRKLAGLDVYYVDGKAVTGDLVTNFITGILGINANGLTYSALSTVFWSFIVFGIIICFAATVIAIVKSHYSYDDKAAKGPMQYIYTAGKAVINMVAVPIIVVLGLYLSQGILSALDSMTSVTSSSVVAMYGDKASLLRKSEASRTQSSKTTYIYYDMFGYGSGIFYGLSTNPNTVSSAESLALIASSNQTFSGALFKVAAYNGNRARLGQIAPKSQYVSGTKEGELFSNATDSETLADMIDTAFACNLHLQQNMNLDYAVGKNWTSLRFFTNFLTQGSSAFSKFNIGLVWYYYDLWNFNFIVGFAACIVCVTLFINIIMGLLARLFMCIGLFLIAPPLFGLSPLDGGKAGKSWTENFMKQALMAYGSVIGMNIFFLILPYMNTIDFFNIAIADAFAQTLIIIVGLITIKAFIAVVSGLVGGADANESGGKIAEEVGQVAGKAAKMTMGAAKVGGAVWSNTIGNIPGIKHAKKGIGKAANKLKNLPAFIKKKGRGKDLNDLDSYQEQSEALELLKGQDSSTFDADAYREQLKQKGFKGKKLDNLVNAASDTAALGGTMDMAGLRAGLAGHDANYGAQTARGWDNKKMFENERIKAQAKYEKSKRLRFMKSAGTVFKSPLTTMLGNMDSIMGESKLYSTFKEKSFWKKEDYAETTAKNTAALLSETKGGRDDMRQGFGTMHEDVGAGFSGVTSGISSMQSDLNSGMGTIGTKIDSASSQAHADSGAIGSKIDNSNVELAAANAVLKEIEKDTDETRRATNRIDRKAKDLKDKSDVIIAENQKANAELEKQTTKLKTISRNVTNIKNKIPKP